MDTLLFIFIIVSIVIVLSVRVYFRQRQVRKDREFHVGGSDLTAGNGEVEHGDDAQRFADVASRFEDTRRKVTAANASSSEALAEISHINKSYGGKPVVNDVSFDILKGEVLGLVGPNGAGKTTTIRMLMDIIKPDSGEIAILGRPLDPDAKNRIGYLPEERGLYRKMKVYDTLVYLSNLKNVSSTVARERAEALLKESDMFPNKDKKVSELSRGMGQIIQFLVTIAHDPDLIVLDEPFAGLDPVNRMLLKNVILELKDQGKTIILSTHMMSEVEEMSDRVLMINQGRVVLYGELAEIKWRFRNNSVFVECEGDIGEIEGVTGRKEHGKHVELFLDGDTPSQDILNQLIDSGVRIDRFEVSTPSLNEIFIQVVKG
ncbi:MAG: ATP-binding cassette domain-containing protein [Chloroflexota bacterium]|nr:ATP-binding cassette domain-containing protein [Chloroflexota bacterium]